MADEVVEEVVAKSGDRKCHIVRRADGTLRVVVFTWVYDDEELAAMCTGWLEEFTAGTVTDSIEIARGVARELLGARGD